MSQAYTLLLERQCRKSSCTYDDFMALLMSVVDEKAVFRTRYNRIPHSTKDVKRERIQTSKTVSSITQNKRKAYSKQGEQTLEDNRRKERKFISSSILKLESLPPL